MPQANEVTHHAAVMATIRSRTAAATPAPLWPPDYWHSPEYRRLQRERSAARQRRVLCGYVPREDRERLAHARWADEAATRRRNRYVATVVRQFNRIATAFPEVAADMRKERAARQRVEYHKHVLRSRLKTTAYKATHPEAVILYGQTRYDRIAATCDGTATKDSIREAKAAAHRCAYCDCPFEDAAKQTDHMVAVCHGGEHSMRNIVIVCRPCNARKASLTYEQWTERVQPEHRARVVCLYLQRHGVEGPALPPFKSQVLGTNLFFAGWTVPKSL